jgi:2,3-bisphosphoglycerate-independent phosphoglycerate mutase
VKAIERVDGVVGTILDGFDGIVAVLPDHPTPIRAKTHTRDPVPFVVRGKGTDTTETYSEAAAAKGGLGMKNATEFLPFLFS